jgi:hypothetical protein
LGASDGLLQRARASPTVREVIDIQWPIIEEIVPLTTQSMPAAATHWSTRALAEVTGHHRPDLEAVVNLYLHPPVRALVISADEKCQFQARDA